MLDRIIKERKSIKKFSDKKPDWRDIIEAIDKARYSPMAGNLFSLKFILIDEQEKIDKLAEASQQDFISYTKYIVVVCSNPSKTMKAFPERGKIYLRQQAGAGIQNFLLKLEELGLSTTWVGHFIDKRIKSILKIPKDIQIEAIFPIGYENKIKKSKPKKKIRIDNILYFNEYNKKRMKK